MLRACVADRALLPAAQSADVRFDEFMADDVGMVRRLYALAGQPFTSAAEAAMRAFMREHPRGKHGRVLYDLAHFDLDRGERRRALAFYAERFGVVSEAGRGSAARAASHRARRSSASARSCGTACTRSAA